MPQFSVMTFNVRQIDGDDGHQSWPHRKVVLVEAIRMHQPALLGTQETWDEQSSYILANLPYYKAFGRGRYGDTRDKHNKVFYDSRRIELLEAGEIWISSTPDIPGTVDWDIPSPRMITWGKMRLDQSVDLVLMNTHFPYGRKADEARHQTVRLILEYVAKLPAGLPIILMGDFNTRAGSEIHELLLEVFTDAWEVALKTIGPEGTIHGFGRHQDGGRIDWILCRKIACVMSAETIVYTAAGLYPSDHYPVSATLELNPESVI